MTVRVVTDSCSDITQQEAKKLGITVVPAYVCFGDEVFRDGVDIDCDQFYKKLVTSPIHPTTAAPSPGDFATVYEEIAKESNQIVSIHVTRRHSAMYESALIAKSIAKDKGIEVEVVDSMGVTMWQGLVAIMAARAARAGYNTQQVVDKAHETIDRLRAMALLDTLRYVIKGGRISNTILALESKLNIKPLITLVNGEIRPAGVVRNRAGGIQRLLGMLSKFEAEEIAIAHSTSENDAQHLADCACKLFRTKAIRIDKLGPALGAHAGPGALVIIAVGGT